MNPDTRLLLPTTHALLDGWCGPVDASGNPAALVWTRDESALVAWLGLGAGSLRQVPVSTLSLDLTLAECRDRGWRVVVAALGGPLVDRPEVMHDEDGLAVLVGDLRDGQAQMYVWDRQGRPAGAARANVPALADLDPNDDTRLPDGSRLVDALALAAVAQQVLGGTP